MGPVIYMVRADFPILGKEEPSAQCKKWLDHPKNWIFEKLRYDYHNVTTGKDTPYPT